MSAGLPGIDLSQIKDPQVRQGMVLLMNLVEELSAENQRLRAENQQLRDEIKRLKGEQGKPDIKASKREAASEHSSEKERRQAEAWEKGKKVPEIRIDRTKVLEVNKSELPGDAEFKGYEEVVVQDVKVARDNILFRKEKYYSPSQRQSYLAPLPLHAEKHELARAGLKSSNWQLADSSSMRINGENGYCHVLANEWYTIFTSKKRKDRQTWLEVVQQSERRRHRLNAEALALLAEMGLAAGKRRQLAVLAASQAEAQEWDEKEFGIWLGLDRHVAGLGPQQRQQVLDATAIAAYHDQKVWPVIAILGSDDAPEFNYLAAIHWLCWVHDGRHYTKLTPFLPHHQETLAAFRKEYWEFYRRLASYRQTPNTAESQRLRTDFQELFTRKTDYRALNERITLTFAKQAQLLVVLDHPEVPLHTNQIERDIRSWVRRRKISGGVRTLAGAKSWDTFLSLAVTARKLGVSFYHYIYDRIAAINQMPSLAQLVTAREQAADQTQQALAPP